MVASKEEAVALKNKGNEFFKQQDWAQAIEYYSKALDAYAEDPSFYTNRAQVCFQPRGAANPSAREHC
jgi:serine/threonine-protein phosphatase 5